MGDSKRRKEILGNASGGDARMYPWLPLTKRQVELFMKWTSTGAWMGIGALVLVWLTVRFIGPAFGWWTVL